MKSGHFITIEGTEGMGKSTVMQAVQTYFQSNQRPLVLTREPGGTPLAESIRALLLANYEEEVSEHTELLLMFASRYQHAQTIIAPALKEGLNVLSDRYVDASYAYQGGGRNIPFKHIDALTQWIPNTLMPDLTLLLDAPVHVGLERIQSRGESDRIEQEKVSFFERVRAAYLARAKAEPNRFVVLDASQDKEAVAAQAVSAIQQWEEAQS